MNTGARSPADEVIAEFPHLRIDNTDRSPEDVADEVLAWLERTAARPKRARSRGGPTTVEER
jgi:hypothetical protein